LTPLGDKILDEQAEEWKVFLEKLHALLGGNEIWVG
jgi:hypothetical protein